MKNFLPSSPGGPWKPDFSRFSGPFRGCCSPFGDQWADFALYGRQSPVEQRRHPGQVVTGKGEDGLRCHLRQANETGLAQTADGLRPTKDSLDPLALLQANCVAGMPRRVGPSHVRPQVPMFAIFHRLTDADFRASYRTLSGSDLPSAASSSYRASHGGVLSVRTQAFVRSSRAVSLCASRTQSFLHHHKPSPNMALQWSAPQAAHP